MIAPRQTASEPRSFNLFAALSVKSPAILDWVDPREAEDNEAMLVRCPEFHYPVMAVRMLGTWFAICEQREVTPSEVYLRGRRSLTGLTKL